MLGAEDAFDLYHLLTSHGIRLWVCGGWGVDALLGVETRSHHDLDVLMLVDDVVRLRRLMARHRYALKDYWEENRWTQDGSGRRVATAFYLHDPHEREFDAHALQLDERGYGTPCWEKEAGFRFTPADLSGEGFIAGRPVACISAGLQMASHSGYVIPAKQYGDIERLHEKFALAYPPEYQRLLEKRGEG